MITKHRLPLSRVGLAVATLAGSVFTASVVTVLVHDGRQLDDVGTRVATEPVSVGHGGLKPPTFAQNPSMSAPIIRSAVLQTASGDCTRGS